MARPRGVRNPGFEGKRLDLLDRLTDFALSTDLKRASLRQFAQAAGVSEPTLRHYFHDRTGVVREIMVRIADRAAPFIEHAATPLETYQASLDAYMELSLAGVQLRGFERAHAFGLIEGVADQELGQAYLETLLEPSLQAIEAKIGRFIDPTAGDPEKVRTAALCLFAPMLLSVLHQRVLGGEATRPLDMAAFFSSIGGLIGRGFPAVENA